MFALNHYNYARWLPVYLSTMTQLYVTRPTVFKNSQKAILLTRKQKKLFKNLSRS